MLKACILFGMMTILGPVASANIVGEESRLPLNQALSTLELSTAEAQAMRESVGVVHCPGLRFGNGLKSTGAIIHADNLVVTNAHAFVDKQGRKREPLETCTFKSFASDKEVPLLVSGSDLTSTTTVDGGRRDFAVARLKKVPKKGVAYPVAPDWEVVTGTSMIVVSAKSVRTGIPFPDNEPIVQSCDLMGTSDARGLSPAVFFGDCDISAGASGSVSLIRVGGRLMAAGVVAGGGPDSQDGHPFNVETLSYSFHISLQNSVRDELERMSGMPVRN